MGTAARRSTSTALRNSVPRLLRRLAAMLGDVEAGLQHLHDRFNLHHGRS
jgi:hypothetical protein